MSDTESIVFHEQIDDDCAANAASLLSRPPLHHSGEQRPRADVPQASPHRDDLASNRSGSVQFCVEAPSRRVSTAGGRAAAAHTSRASNAGPSDAHDSEADGGSIHFFVEESGSCLKSNGATRLGSSRGASICFQVEEDGKTEFSCAATNAFAAHVAGASKATSSAAVGAKEAIEKVAEKAAPSLGGKSMRSEAEVSKRSSTRKTFLSNWLQRSRTNSTHVESLAKLENIAGEKGSKNTRSASLLMRTAAGEESSKAHTVSISNRAPSSDARGSVGHVLLREGGRLVATDCSSPDDAVSHLGRPSQRPQRPKNRGAVKQTRAKKAMDSAVASSPESPLPLKDNAVPRPYPQATDAMRPHVSFEMKDLILQAKLYTEHWRLFNEAQRKELARLVQQVMEARRMDSSQDNVYTAPKRTSMLRPDLNDFSAFLNAEGLKVREDDERRRKGAKFSAGGSSCVAAPRKSFPLGGVHVQRRNAASLRKPERETQPVDSPDKSEHFLQPAAATSWFSRLHDAPSRDAVARLAQSLGVLWPPKSQDALFFMTGSRLTEQQRDEFYRAAALQSGASTKVHAELKGLCKEEGLGQRKATRVRPLVTRTSILRKVFALMDVEKKGVIHATELPALRRLLEAERQQLKDDMSGEVSPVSVLARAREERRLLEGTLDTRRPSERAAGLPPPVSTQVMLYSFLLDVIFPLLFSSGFVLFDFATLGLLVFGSIGLSENGASSKFVEWRQAAMHYFEILV